MTTKRNPKKEQYRNLENFYETKWSKQSVTTDNQARKNVRINKYLRLLFSEIELHGNENESKKDTVLKKILFKFNLIWKSLKQTAINSNLQLRWVICPWGNNWNLSLSDIWLTITTRQKNAKFCEMCLSPKSMNYCTKRTVSISRYAFFQSCFITMIFVN